MSGSQKTLVKCLDCSINIYQARWRVFYMYGFSISYHSAKVGIIISVLQIRKPKFRNAVTQKVGSRTRIGTFGVSDSTAQLILFYFASSNEL